MNPLRSLLALSACATLAGCSILMRPTQASEQVNPQVDQSTMSAIVVIAGDDARYDLRMASLVRDKLTEAGFNGIRRSGRWASENEALNDICPTNQVASADGIIFVYYNQLILWDCKTRLKAIQVFGGTEAGLPGMTDRVIAYLQAGRRQSGSQSN